MRKFTLAALVSLPFFAMGVQQASAGCCDGFCTPTCRVGMCIGLNWRGWCLKDRGPVDPCPNCGPCGGGCGGGACGYGPVPPWYTFWPGGGGGVTPFPTPAPTGYPYWPAPQAPVAGPLFGANFNNQQAPTMPASAPMQVQPCGYYYPQQQVQPCGYYPQQPPAYWYGQ